jgi:hypothetical protein
VLLLLWDQTLLKHRRISTVPLLSRDCHHGLSGIGLVQYLTAHQWGAGYNNNVWQPSPIIMGG